MVKRKYFKLNREDILEIVTEALAKDHGFGTFNSRAELFVDGEEVFFVGAIGEEDDTGVFQENLDVLYKNLDYNGTHDGRGCFSSEKWSEIINDLIDRGSL